MRIREWIIAGMLTLGGISTVGCDDTANSSAKASAEGADKEGEEGASKEPDAPAEDGEAKDGEKAKDGERPSQRQSQRRGR